MKKTSRRNNRRHAIHRAEQRYGVVLSKYEYEGLVNQVRFGKSIFVQRVGNNRTAHLVTLKRPKWVRKKVPMLAIYDKCKKSIVTFLPREAWEVIENDSP